MKALLVLFVMLTSLPAAAAIHPDERMADPALEARAQALYRALRCTTCQNQTIAGSNADIAVGLRAAVRRQLEAGQSDEEILAFLHERYGDFVLMTPPFAAHTWLLWLGPLLALLGGGALCLRIMMTSGRAPS